MNYIFTILLTMLVGDVVCNKYYYKVGRKWYIDKEWLYDMYENKMMSISEISKIIGCSRKIISEKLNKYNIQKRTMSEEQLKNKSKRMNEIKIDDFLIDFINGLLLGDGSIPKVKSGNNYLEIYQRESKIEWLYYIKNIFDKYNIYSKITLAKDEENREKLYVLFTERLPLFTKLRNNWYKNKKIIPDNLNIKPITLAMWMCGDGSLIYYEKNNTYSIKLYTNGFDEIFVKKLNNLIYYMIHMDLNLMFIKKKDINMVII